MSFWKKLMGVKEPPKAARVETKAPRPVIAQPPAVHPSLNSPRVQKLRNALTLALIYEAARDGDVEQVRGFFQNNPDVVLRKESYRGVTPLHLAAEQGNLPMAQLLIEKGAHVNARTKFGLAPLHLAAEHGHAKMAALLLDNKADANAVDKENQTPLHHAAAKGQSDVVELLLARDADVNARATFGRTPLHEVARRPYLGTSYRHKEVAEMLVAHGADVNALDQENQTPLHLAAERGMKDMVELLLAHHAKVNVRANFGGTPLSYALRDVRYKPVAELLRQHGGRE